MSVHSPIFELLVDERREIGGGEEKERLDKGKTMLPLWGLSDPLPPLLSSAPMLLWEVPLHPSQAVSGPGRWQLLFFSEDGGSQPGPEFSSLSQGPGISGSLGGYFKPHSWFSSRLLICACRTWDQAANMS